MIETVIPRRIGFKSVLVLILTVSIGLLLLSKPFMSAGMPKEWSIFLATGISTSLGLSLVLLKIEGPVTNSSIRKKRLLVGIIVSIAISFVMAFVVK
ncbi:hypothetical protein [Rossellomorea marisflavi]|nr:hypothetical protein [Rossellomorea marisflavi]MCM2588528.1 hypothetical protein [Rossellomorea marisflavi]MCM2605335.1 hypothetical protein [Rossellomorea marisflavi]USK93525.1 hypothetical protein LIT29_07185 [Rossellomorea marisflavi]UTE71653.1 hypothetical protein M1I95_15455 [Rossellomorea marisflavi]GLI86243.1 hypothetical protein ANABIO32_40250 [Rossellomorea marisflavi]